MCRQFGAPWWVWTCSGRIMQFLIMDYETSSGGPGTGPKNVPDPSPSPSSSQTPSFSTAPSPSPRKAPSSSRRKRQRLSGPEETPEVSSGLDTSRVRPDSLFPKDSGDGQDYYTLSSSSDQKLTEYSSIRVWKALMATVGKPKHVEQLRSDYLVQARDKEQAKALETLTSLGDIPVSVKTHQSLNISRGVIRDRLLSRVTEDELVGELPHVTHAQRITLRKAGRVVQTNTFILTFDTKTPLKSVEVCWTRLKVDPYVARPLRCFKCQRFGHAQKFCRRSAACCRCGSDKHEEKNCKSDPRCVNCHGAHSAASKECPDYLRETAIQRYRAEHGGTFAQARAAVVVSSPLPVPGVSYAKAAIPPGKKKATAPAGSSKNKTAPSSGAKTHQGPPADSKAAGQKTAKSRDIPPLSPSVKTSNRFTLLADNSVPTSLSSSSPVPLMEISLSPSLSQSSSLSLPPFPSSLCPPPPSPDPPQTGSGDSPLASAEMETSDPDPTLPSPALEVAADCVAATKSGDLPTVIMTGGQGGEGSAGSSSTASAESSGAGSDGTGGGTVADAGGRSGAGADFSGTGTGSPVWQRGLPAEGSKEWLPQVCQFPLDSRSLQKN